MKGLRIVGWGAAAVALLGAGAMALLVGHLPLRAGMRTGTTLYGATFVPMGDDRPGLVVTSLRSDLDGDPGTIDNLPLHVGDTVVAVDGRPATSFSLLRDEALRNPEAPLRLRIMRDHGLHTITLLRTGSGGLRGQQDFVDRR
ncbi:hypothetical protein ACFX59_00955 [Sphingomonas sp. NCPPB 2930]|uniref:hypothetical protein n=1 Tax=Sphingomonas sp. NCPPB 2930 TaxID=3162788 RepID=UPI0036DE65E7